MYAEPQTPEVIDISHDTRPWNQVCPDDYFSLEYVADRKMPLHIVAVRQEKVGDKMKAVLRFSNDPRGLVLNKTNRDALVKLYGDTPAAVVNQWITIGLGFVNRNPSLLILGKASVAAAPVTPPTQPAAAAAPVMSPELAAQFAQFQKFQQQQAAAGGAAGPTFPGSGTAAAG